MPNVNLYDGSINPEPVHTLALVDVLDHIQQGTYQAAVERVRKILHTQGQDAYNETKRALPAATFCGTFAPTRAKANLQAHSGVIHGDIDHLQDKDDLAAKKQRLRVDPFTVYLFESPSATGLKVGLHVNRLPDDASYKHAWQAAADYHRAQYGIVWDRSGKDIGRLCYVSWDPDLYRNLDAPLFPVPPFGAEAGAYPRPVRRPAQSPRALCPAGDRDGRSDDRWLVVGESPSCAPESLRAVGWLYRRGHPQRV
jgi:hypothetical protein